jgi:hypothetical protein
MEPLPPDTPCPSESVTQQHRNGSRLDEGVDKRLGPAAGEAGERPDTVGAAVVAATGEGPTRRRRWRGNPAVVGPNKAEAGTATGKPDAVEVGAEATNHLPAVEEGWARIG